MVVVGAQCILIRLATKLTGRQRMSNGERKKTRRWPLAIVAYAKRLFVKPIFVCAIGIAANLSGCSTGGLTLSQASPSIYATAHGEGATKQSALNDAFRDAIQRSAGVLINSQMVMQNGRITQDLIQEYSGAFILSYEITRQRQTPNGYSVDIAANVSSTKLANRLLELSKRGDSARPQTDQFYAQVSTLLKSRTQGDSFIANVLNEFPQGALKVNVGRPTPRVTDNRDVYLDVPVEIRWSKTYLDALKETFKFVSIGSCSAYAGKSLACPYDVAFTNLGVLGRSSKGYKLADNKQASLVYSRLRPQVVVVVNLYGAGDHLVGKKCLSYDMSENLYEPRLGRAFPIQLMTVFNGVDIVDQSYRGHWPLKFVQPEDMRAIQRIDAEVMAGCPADAQL